MPASQISFVDFALAQQAAASCTPLVQNTAIEVVAHPAAADVGECIRVVGIVRGTASIGGNLRDDFLDSWCCAGDSPLGAALGAGMDAPCYLPGGSHTALICGGRHLPQYALTDGLSVSRWGY